MQNDGNGGTERIRQFLAVCRRLLIDTCQDGVVE
jgi:hypothetical protein